jgi:DNA-binding XRE family transcriptional regulator
MLPVQGHFLPYGKMSIQPDERAIRVNSVAEIGRAIRSARKDQGLTQREFAEIVGVGVRYLSELERGKSTAELGLALKVLAGAGLDVVLQPRGLPGRDKGSK